MPTRTGCCRGRLVRAIALVVAACVALAALGWRQQIANCLILVDVRFHRQPRWDRWLPRDRSTYDMLEEEFRRSQTGVGAVAHLLGKPGCYPHGFRRLQRLVEDGSLPAYKRWRAASELPGVRHPRADRYVQLLLENTSEDDMRCLVLEGFSHAGRRDEHVDAALKMLPKMRDHLAISRALSSAASQTRSRRVLPMVLRYAEAENETVRETAVEAADSLFWNSPELDDEDCAQIVEMWRRIAAENEFSWAATCLFVAEHAGLPREPQE